MVNKKTIREDGNELLQKSNEKIVFIGFDQIDNPLIEEVEDPRQIKKFFEEKSYIPYAGSIASSGHTLLSYYDTMAILSPTSYSILQNKINTSFSGHPILVENESDIFGGRVEIKDNSVFNEISELLKYVGFDRGHSILNLPENIFDGIFKNGNAYIEVVLAEVLGQKVAAIYVHKQRNVLYNIDSGEYDNLVAISALWDAAYLKKYPATEIPVFPEMKEFKDGTIRTIIHVKRGGGKYYGRPRNEGCFYELFNEYQDSEYKVKQSANEWTGRTILEVEDADTRQNRIIDGARDRAAGYKGTFDRFDKHYTSKAKDPRTFLLLSRPYGATPMTHISIPPMTKEKYYKVNKELNAKTIIGVHGWSKWLLGDSASSGLSTNMILDALKLVEMAEVPNIQERVLKAQNTALKIIYDWFNIPELKKYSFAYKLKSQSFENNTNSE